MPTHNLPATQIAGTGRFGEFTGSALLGTAETQITFDGGRELRRALLSIERMDGFHPVSRAMVDAVDRVERNFRNQIRRMLRASAPRGSYGSRVPNRGPNKGMSQRRGALKSNIRPRRRQFTDRQGTRTTRTVITVGGGAAYYAKAVVAGHSVPRGVADRGNEWEGQTPGRVWVEPNPFVWRVLGQQRDLLVAEYRGAITELRHEFIRRFNRPPERFL